jgi:hypothetical protein
MNAIRRWYIFLVCAVSLNVVAWAVIALARNLLVAGVPRNALGVAFEIAVVIIGLPLFLVHWLWAQRLARGDPAERGAALRHFYLYAMQAGFLGPILANAFGLLSTLLGALGLGRRVPYGFTSAANAMSAALVAIVALAALWVYHQRLTAAGSAADPESAGPMQRLYRFGFAVTGYTMVALATIHLLRWLLFAVGDSSRTLAGLNPFNLEVTRLVIGLPVWLVFWLQAQRAFAGGDPAERESTVRQLYLYGVVFVAVVNVVTNLAFIFAGLLRRLLSLPSQGDLRQPLPIIVILAVSWAYHAWVLRADGAVGGEAPRQAGLRRLYLYLVAATGLTAVLIGLSGDLSVLIRTLFASRGIQDDLANQFAWFTAALVAGLPVWAIPWRSAQAGAVAAGPAGAEERQAGVRKLYLYLFLFVATMTFLSSAVSLVFRVISALLSVGEGGGLADIAQAVGFCVLAVGVWVYHGLCLRGDGRRAQQEQTARLAGYKVAVVEMGQEQFGHRVAQALRRDLPGLAVELFDLAPAAPQPVAGAEPAPPRAFVLSQAELIVGPWQMIAAVEGGRAIQASLARKLVAPVAWSGWEWVGTEAAGPEAYVTQMVQAVKQAAQGTVKSRRPLSVGAIVGIVVLVIVGVLVVLPAIFWLYYTGGF